MSSRKTRRGAPSPAAPQERRIGSSPRTKRSGLTQWLQLHLFPSSTSSASSAPAPPPRRDPEIRVPARLRAAVREEQAQRLARKLTARMKMPLASLTLTDNRSVLLSTSRHGGRLKLRLHRAFVDADREALEAAAAFAAGCAGDHRREALRRLRNHVDTWRQDNGKAAAPINPPEHHTDGDWHDLAAIRDHLSRRWFRSRVEPDITWGRWSSLRGRRRTIRLGSFDARENLIRVHPALDQSWVPRLFVEAVVHHEMLHAAMPAKESGGRRCLHGPEFRRRERELPAYAAAEKWLATNLHKLLRTRPQR